MKIHEMRGKSDAELRNLLSDFRKERLNLRFQVANGQLENTSRHRVVRRSIARAKTLLQRACAPANKDVSVAGASEQTTHKR